MTTWHVTVSFTAATPFEEDAPFEVAESLGDYGASLSVAPDFSAGEILMTLDAETAVDATERGAELASGALNGYIPAVDLIGIRAQSEDAFQSELAEPIFPEVVGFAEIAEMAGVTRQRARQFVKVAEFPEPVIETAQGPLLSKAAVSRWLESRNTTPGRPRVSKIATS